MVTQNKSHLLPEKTGEVIHAGPRTVLKTAAGLQTITVLSLSEIVIAQYSTYLASQFVY
jgi:hypothetical protein